MSPSIPTALAVASLNVTVKQGNTTQ